MKRVLIMSGGGAKGAFGTGVIDYLYNDLGIRWNLMVGVSTGSLLMPLTALGEIDKLKEVYTSVTNDDLWNYFPFTKNGKPSAMKVGFRELQTMLLKKQQGWGDMGKLKHIIKNWFPEENYSKIIDNGIEMVSCAINLTLGKKEYFSNFNNNYSRFVESIMASSAFPVFTNTVKIDDFEYADGGIMEHIPLQYAIDRGADVIDIIVHRPKKFNDTDWKSKGGMSQLLRTIDLHAYEISENDLNSKFNCHKKVVLNVIYTPYRLTKNSIDFDKEKMLDWQKEGYRVARSIFTGKGQERKVVMSDCFRRRNLPITNKYQIK